MATRPGQHLASPAELVRADVGAQIEDHPQTGHLLRRTTRQHTYRHNVVSRLLRRTPLKGFVQALTENAVPKPLILLLGVCKLAPNVF